MERPSIPCRGCALAAWAAGVGAAENWQHVRKSAQGSAAPANPLRLMLLAARGIKQAAARTQPDTQQGTGAPTHPPDRLCMRRLRAQQLAHL